MRAFRSDFQILKLPHGVLCLLLCLKRDDSERESAILLVRCNDLDVFNTQHTLAYLCHIFLGVVARNAWE